MKWISKNLSVTLFLCLVIFTYCADNTTESSINKYQGKWQWYKTAGGFAPRIITPAEGYRLIVRFDALGRFMIIVNDTVKVEANYFTGETLWSYEKLIFTDLVTYNYHFDSENQYAKVHSDTLEISDGAMDGFTSFYRKTIY
jgi:hypothetical protein